MLGQISFSLVYAFVSKKEKKKKEEEEKPLVEHGYEGQMHESMHLNP